MSFPVNTAIFIQIPFAENGDIATVPFATQPDGTVSYNQGYPIDYSTPVADGGRNIERTKMNQLFNDLTAIIQQIQVQGAPEWYSYVASNGGYPKYARVIYTDGNVYKSLIPSNADTPGATSNWQLESLGSVQWFSGGITTGSANSQVLATVIPSGFSLSNNGATVSCNAGFTNTGSTQFNIAGTGLTTVYKWGGSSYIALTGGEIVASESIFLTVNTAIPGLVLTDTPVLGSAANKTATNNADTFLSSVTGAGVVGNAAIFADTNGSIKNSGTTIRQQLTGNLNLYVNGSTGSDSNNGLSALTPWQTLQKAANYVMQTIDQCGFQVTINVADYNNYAPVFFNGVAVGQSVSINLTGNVSSMNNVVIQIPSNQAGVEASGNVDVYVQGMKFVRQGGTATGCVALASANAANINFNTVNFGDCSSTGTHLSCGRFSELTGNGDYTISGSAGVHVDVGSAGANIVINPCTVTLTGTPDFSLNSFAFVFKGYFGASGVTWSGSATGPKFNLSANGVIYTAGAGSSYLPGNSAGTTASGGQYI